MTDVTVTIDNVSYLGWTELTVTTIVGELCGDFSFSLVDFPFEDVKKITAGKEVVIAVGDQRVMTGYIFAVSRTCSGSERTFNFSGRAKTADLIDASAVYKTSNWRRKKLSAICKDICQPFGISVTTMIEDILVDRFALQNGESPFDSIERLLRAYAVLPLTDSDGNLVLSSPSEWHADVDLVVGSNVLVYSDKEDQESRFSSYSARAQSRGNGSTWAKDNTSVFGEAADAGIGRYRPFIFIAEKHMTKAEARKRAAWEAQVRAGRGVGAEVTVVGWHQDPEKASSRLWTVNELVHLVHEAWSIDTTLLITSVTLSLTEQEGRTTVLGLSPPEIFSPNPGDRVELARKSFVRPA